MKIVKEPDGMYVREAVHLTAEDIGTPEANKVLKESSRRYDVYLTLDDYRAEYEKVLAEVNNSDKDPEHLARRRKDLSAMRDYIDYTEQALRNRECKRAVLCGIALGITSHKALYARSFEPDVLHLRKGRKTGGLKAAPKIRAKRKRLDDEDRPKYRKRMLELRTNGVKYGVAAYCIEREFRQKPHDRHHAKRIRELAPNPVPRKDSTPPKDYIR